MFSGIIEKTGRIESIEERSQGREIVVSTGFTDLSLGESVAQDGVCLTVTACDPTGRATFFVGPETLRLTTLGSWKQGRRVNLERAVRAQDRLSGHWVQGHVDAVIECIFLQSLGESTELRFHVPKKFSQYVVTKGSITFNGVSLTVNQITDHKTGTDVSVTIIPHTWSHTNLSDLQPQSSVNVEFDSLSKIVERLWTVSKQP